MEGEKKEEIYVVLGCMDRRLVEIFKLLDNQNISADEKVRELEWLYKEDSAEYREMRKALVEMNGKNVVIVTNAGANVSGVKETLEELSEKYSIKKAFWAGHSDCGAMGVIRAYKESGVHDEISAHLGVDKYLTKEYALKDPEEVNAKIQIPEFERIVTEVVKLEINVSALKLPEKEKMGHAVVIADPKIGGYSSNFVNVPKFGGYGTIALKNDVEKIDFEGIAVAKLNCHPVSAKAKNKVH